MNGPPRGAASARGEGFTLVEVAVVIAMIGVLVAVALVVIQPRSAAARARGYADEVAALCDAARQRAVATRKVQVLRVEPGRIVHEQAAAIGLDQQPAEDPEDDPGFERIGMLPAPRAVSIAALAARTHDRPAEGDVPEVGTGLPGVVLFRPDGTGQGATIFIEDSQSENRARVAIYSATGAAYAYHEW